LNEEDESKKFQSKEPDETVTIQPTEVKKKKLFDEYQVHEIIEKQEVDLFDDLIRSKNSTFIDNMKKKNFIDIEDHTQ
jgi:hypothetical protein